jgi:hypothetical protein
LDHEQYINDLRQRAAKYRTLARQITDNEAAERIFQLAAELDEKARAARQSLAATEVTPNIG